MFVKTRKWKPMELILSVLLALQYLAIVCSNLFILDQNLDCDNTKMMKHIMTMWERRTLLIPDWSYPSTLEWDCTTVFALPFYGITGDIFLSCGLSNCLLTLIFLGAVFYLFKEKELLYPLVCANLICIPYRVGMLDYYNMLFFGGAQYIVKVTVPLLLVGLILAGEKQGREEKKISKSFLLMAGIYFVLLWIAGMSSGIYVIACGLVPIIVGYVLYKFFKWERVPFRVGVLGGLTAVSVVGSLIINTHGMGGAKGQGMELLSVYHFFGNITGCFVGIFELFGGVLPGDEMAVLSKDGIMAVGKICIVVLLLVCGFRAFVKCIKKQGDLCTLMLSCIFVWNLFVLCITKTKAGSNTFEYRYHLIGIIPAVCLMGETLITGMRKLKKEQQRILFACVFGILVFLNLVSYRDLFARGEQNADLKEFVAYCDTLDFEYIYMFDESNNGDICRALGKNLYMCICDDGKVYAYDYYKQFEGELLPSTNGIVAVNEELEDFGDEFMILDKKLVKFDKIGKRNLYYFAE